MASTQETHLQSRKYKSKVIQKRHDSYRQQAQKSGDAWLSNLSEKIEKAKTSMLEAHAKMKEQNDKKRVRTTDKGHNVVFAQKGTFVYLTTEDMKNLSTVARQDGIGHDTAVEPKWLPRYLGPFEVVEVCGESKLNRRLKLPTSLQERLTTDIFHVSKLKMASRRGQTLDLSETIPPPAKSGDEDEEFYVEAITGHVDNGKKGRWYQVRGVGYANPQDYWYVHEYHMQNLQELLKAYLQGIPREIAGTKKQIAELSTKRRKSREAE